MEEAWREFLVSGKVTDYLRYRSAEPVRIRESEAAETQKERPDGAEYRSDRDGLKCDADWRL